MSCGSSVDWIVIQEAIDVLLMVLVFSANFREVIGKKMIVAQRVN